MKHFLFRACTITFILTICPIHEVSAWSPITLQSGPEQISLLELYTSEGCSSCPPAEAWLSGQSSNPDLWKKFVPIAFHVDYWNYLGWPDPYSSEAFTARQRAYSGEWNSPTIYTPEFVLNGREWKSLGFSIPSSQREVGKLSAELNANGNLKVVFEPTMRIAQELVVEASLLGHGIITKVQRGENAGRTLNHGFLSLGLQKTTLQKGKGGRYEAIITLPVKTPVPAAALVLWVHPQGNPTPLQSVGGWLSNSN